MVISVYSLYLYRKVCDMKARILRVRCWLLNVTFEDFLHIQFPGQQEAQSAANLQKSSLSSPLTYDKWLESQRDTQPVDHTSPYPGLTSPVEPRELRVSPAVTAATHKNHHSPVSGISSTRGSRSANTSTLSPVSDDIEHEHCVNKYLSVTMMETMRRTDISLSESGSQSLTPQVRTRQYLNT